jgi:uncharacterized protein (DUF2147 family)
MKKLFFFLAIATFMSVAATTAEKNIEGVWKTIDDVTGKEKSHVKIYKAQNGKYYGKVLKLVNRGPEEDPDPVCSKCPKGDYRYNQKVVDMKILSGLEEKGDEYVNGTILDPKNGKIYNCKVWLENKNTLKLRGYLGPVYRTQTWHRVE